MDHMTEIVRQDQPTNECVTITIRCCGDSTTDETVTIHGLHKLSAQELESYVDQHHDAVALKHQAMANGKSHLEQLKNRSKQHVNPS